MPENQTAWNSDNQGIKETFTQTGRRIGGGWKQAAKWKGHTERQRTAGVRRGLAEEETKDSS